MITASHSPLRHVKQELLSLTAFLFLANTLPFCYTDHDLKLVCRLCGTPWFQRCHILKENVNLFALTFWNNSRSILLLVSWFEHHQGAASYYYRKRHNLHLGHNCVNINCLYLENSIFWYPSIAHSYSLPKFAALWNHVQKYSYRIFIIHLQKVSFAFEATISECQLRHNFGRRYWKIQLWLNRKKVYSQFGQLF